MKTHAMALKWLAAWLSIALLLTIVFFAGVRINNETSNHLYDNQIAACIRENPVRKDFHTFANQVTKVSHERAKLSTGKEKEIALKAAKQYHKIAIDLSGEEFALPDGTIDCIAATNHP